MDEKPERPAAEAPDLAAALRRARIENAERAGAIAELRELELGRLALLESALKRVVRQAPPGVDLFDLTLAKGDRPRVFLDMVAFIEMARDRRTYRFFQDTLYGRVLIAESPKIDVVVAACANYVARRLVERERALQTEVSRDEVGEAALHAPLGPPEPTGAPKAVPNREQVPPPARSRGFWRSVGAVLAFLLMAVGAATLVSVAALLVALAANHRLGEAWSHVRNAAPLLNAWRP